jgi:S-adenosylmethionine:tRNA ribosyltransferase-isomerase
LSFLYDLPEEQIAQRPAPRGSSRLLVVGEDELVDRKVSELVEILEPGDLLLLNDTKVLAARFFPKEVEEILLLEALSPGIFRALARPLRRLKVGQSLVLSRTIIATVVEIGAGEAVLRLEADGNLEAEIEETGSVPIPPYIRQGRSDRLDRDQYQTVFAKNPGSIAAPTASLHLTDEMLGELQTRGVQINYITLHVGESSILSVARQIESKGSVSAEKFVIPIDTFRAISRTKERGGRIVGVGTTVARAVESLTPADWQGAYDFSFRSTELFISEGFEFNILDYLMTNFHLSGSTHLSLVCAFAGTEQMLRAYQHAVSSGYRFLSYGDSSLLRRRVF